MTEMGNFSSIKLCFLLIFIQLNAVYGNTEIVNFASRVSPAISNISQFISCHELDALSGTRLFALDLASYKAPWTEVCNTTNECSHEIFIKLNLGKDYTGREVGEAEVPKYSLRISSTPSPPADFDIEQKILWGELSRLRTNPNAINWAALSAQLDVPVPYLLHRAQVKYQEDLRGLQGIRQGPLSAGPAPSTPGHSPADDRPYGLSAQRAVTGRVGSGNSNPLSPTASTPTSALTRRLSSSGPLGSRWSRGSNASTHTIIQPPTTTGPPTRMLKLNPVLTPLRTATGSRPSTPSSGQSTPSGTDSEAEREAKLEAQREEADQLAQKLKDLQKKMGSGSFGFAKARPKQVEGSPTPSVSASQTRSQSATVSLPRMQRSLMTPTKTAMTADTSETPTSASASLSQRGSIPDIPSPMSDSRTRLPARVSRRATSANARRSPSNAPEVQDRGPVGRMRAQEVGSGQVSSASSFSDLSDMSASALEDALMSNNFKSTTAASRMSMFSRAHQSRGHNSTRHGRYP